jgi:aspartate aminotransferase-like enzyme
VPNATTGINIVLRNLTYAPGDHILYFSTIYGACEKTIEYIAETTPAKSAKIAFTYPVEDDWLVDAFVSKVKEIEAQGGKVKLATFDTVVSMPGVRMPFERLIAACKELGVLSFVDGAHGVGHLEMDLGKLDPDFIVSNCHKYVSLAPCDPLLHCRQSDATLTYIETTDGSTSPAAPQSSTSRSATNPSSAPRSPPPTASSHVTHPSHRPSPHL